MLNYDTELNLLNLQATKASKLKTLLDNSPEKQLIREHKKKLVAVNSCCIQKFQTVLRNFGYDLMPVYDQIRSILCSKELDAKDDRYNFVRIKLPNNFSWNCELYWGSGLNYEDNCGVRAALRFNIPKEFDGDGCTLDEYIRNCYSWKTENYKSPYSRVVDHIKNQSKDFDIPLLIMYTRLNYEKQITNTMVYNIMVFAKNRKYRYPFLIYQYHYQNPEVSLPLLRALDFIQQNQEQLEERLIKEIISIQTEPIKDQIENFNRELTEKNKPDCRRYQKELEELDILNNSRG